MQSKAYNGGATFGLDAYLYERQFCGTFENPSVTGYLAACARGGEFYAGVSHGIALGAALALAQRDETLALRATA